jgi:hypothetical protein
MGRAAAAAGGPLLDYLCRKYEPLYQLYVAPTEAAGHSAKAAPPPAAVPIRVGISPGDTFDIPVRMS